jgi:hypothetical protein
VSRWPPKLVRRSARHVWGVGTSGFAWRSASGEVHAIQSPAGSVPSQAMASLAPGDRIDVVAANDVAVHWLQAATPSARSLAELRLAAGARCTQLFGGAVADWHVAGDWHAARAFMCAAVARPMLDGLRAALDGRRATVRWHSAWSLACARERSPLPADGWIALRSPTRIALWHCVAGRVVHFSLLTTVHDAPATWVAEQVAHQIQVEAAREPALAVVPTVWLAGSVHAAPSEAVAALELAG